MTLDLLFAVANNPSVVSTSEGSVVTVLWGRAGVAARPAASVGRAQHTTASLAFSGSQAVAAQCPQQHGLCPGLRRDPQRGGGGQAGGGVDWGVPGAGQH